MVGLVETRYDLKFRLLGVPVRVHPFFWAVSAMMGWQPNKIPMVLLWVFCVFVSILVHEFGHALMSMVFRCSPSIVLWGMGGLCYSQGERQSPRERLAVVLAGPAAGFLLLGVVVLLSSLFFGISLEGHVQAAGSVVGHGQADEVAIRIGQRVGYDTAGDFAYTAYRCLVFINLYWGLLNLLPIWPLDGGQASQILLSLFDRHRGQRWSHVVSLLVAGVLALVVFQLSKDMFMTAFFGVLAFMNFQKLQTLQQAHSLGMYQEDDWWRR
jgi:stage IV sporulation protein FB